MLPSVWRLMSFSLKSVAGKSMQYTMEDRAPHNSPSAPSFTHPVLPTHMSPLSPNFPAPAHDAFEFCDTAALH